MKQFLSFALALALLFSLSACGMYSKQDLDDTWREAYNEGYEDGLSDGEFLWGDSAQDEGYEEGYEDGYNDGTRKGSEYVYDELSPGTIEDALSVIMSYSEGEASWSEFYDAVSQIRRYLGYAKDAMNYYR